MRRLLPLLLAAYLLGVATTFAFPGLLYERQTIVAASPLELRRWASAGWVVVATHGESVYTMERPRALPW